MSKRHLVTVQTKFNSESISKIDLKAKELSPPKFKGPDFMKIVPREKIQRTGVKKRLFPFLDLNYEVTRRSKEQLN